MEQKHLNRAAEIAQRIAYLKQVIAADFTQHKQRFSFDFTAEEKPVMAAISWTHGWKLSETAINAATKVILSEAIAELANLRDEAFSIGLKLED